MYPDRDTRSGARRTYFLSPTLALTLTHLGGCSRHCGTRQRRGGASQLLAARVRLEDVHGALSHAPCCDADEYTVTGTLHTLGVRAHNDYTLVRCMLSRPKV